MVGAKKWERQAQRVDSRNGTYLRRLITSMGAIDLKVPRSREGGSAGGAVVRPVQAAERGDRRHDGERLRPRRLDPRHRPASPRRSWAST